MIPYVDKEIAINIINQFPVYVDFGKAAIEQYTQVCNSILEQNRESQISVVQGYQTILDALSKRMEREDISAQERKSITEDMIEIADKIKEFDLNNKKFFDKMGNKILMGIVFVVTAIGAGIGINSTFGSSSSLPEVQDDNEDDKT